MGSSSACVTIDYLSYPTVSDGNTINRNGSYSIYNGSKNTIDATYNTWFSMLNYGNVNTTGGVFYKPGSADEPKILFDLAKSNFDKQENSTALDVYKNLLVNYSDSKYARSSLNYIMKILEGKTENREDNILYFREIKNELITKESSGDLKIIIEMLELYWIQRTGYFKEAEKKYDELIAKSEHETLINDLKFRKALFYIYETKEVEKGIPLLKELVSFENSFADAAGNELKQLNISSKPEVLAETKPVTESILKGNYPNPFNPETVIKYSVKDAGNINIRIYNVLGQNVKTLLNTDKNTGRYEVKWDGTNNYGDKVSSGVYFYRMTVNGQVLDTKKMLMLK